MNMSFESIQEEDPNLSMESEHTKNSEDELNKYDSDEEDKNQPISEISEDEINARYVDDILNEKDQDENDSSNKNSKNIFQDKSSSLSDFDCSSFNFIHPEIVSAIKEILTLLGVNQNPNYSHLFLVLETNLSFETLDQMIFYTEALIFILKITKNKNCLENHLNVLQRIGKNIADNCKNKPYEIFSEYLKEQQNKNGGKEINYKNCKEFKQIIQIRSNAIKIIDYISEIFVLISSIQCIRIQRDFLTSSIQFLSDIYSEKNNKLINNNLKNEEINNLKKIKQLFSDFSHDEIISIKRYSEFLKQIMNNEVNKENPLSIDEFKMFFELYLYLFKDKTMSNIYLSVIENIVEIIEMVNDNDFVKKCFIEINNCFMKYLEANKFNEESYKYHLLAFDPYTRYIRYFGEYILITKEQISVMTFFILKLLTHLYVKKRSSYIEIIKEFLDSILDNKSHSFLLFFFVLLKDILKLKYDAEFNISMNLLMELFNRIILNLNDTNLSVKERNFFANLLNILVKDLLTDLNSLSESYLCFGPENTKLTSYLLELKEIKENALKLKNREFVQYYNTLYNEKIRLKRGRKKRNFWDSCKYQKQIFIDGNCPCFSCSFTKFNKNEAFKCKKCNIKTNLRLDLVNPEKDEDSNVCGFCNIKGFFDSFGTIFDNEKNIELLQTSHNDYILSDYLEKYRKNILDDLKLMRAKIRKEKKKEFMNQKENESKEKDEKNKKFYEEYMLIKNEEIVNYFNEHEEEYNNAKFQDNILFTKFLFYQDLIYKNSFLFLKINLLNFIKTTNDNHNPNRINNLNKSFKCFLLSLIDKEKFKDNQYIEFINDLTSFYENQKKRIFGLNSDIFIDSNTIKYFYFLEFYINFLFSANWEIVKLIIDDKVHWHVRYGALKILGSFAELNEDVNVFHNYSIKIIGKLLTDNSFHIREYSFELLFKLFQKGKITKNKLIEILYSNINETSFCIRKKAIRELANLVYQSKDKETLKPILYIFFEKLNDNSESLKIKGNIYSFFISMLNNTNGLLNLILETLLDIIYDTEQNIDNTINVFEEELGNLMEIINPKIKTFTMIFEYLLNNYLLSPKIIETRDLKEQLHFISTLTLVKIISKYDYNSVAIYISTFSEILSFNSEIQENTNKVLTLGIEIIKNLILGNLGTFTSSRNTDVDFEDMDIGDLVEENNSCKTLIKSAMYRTIYGQLQEIMYKKIPLISYKALDVIYIMTQQGLVNILPLFKFCGLNYNFLKKCMNNPITIVNNPISVTVKSLGLFCKIINKLSDNDLMNIFRSLFKSVDEVSDEIFKMLSFYFYLKFDYSTVFYFEDDLSEKQLELLRGLSIKAFDCFCSFWIKFPKYLKESNDIFEKSLGNMKSVEEKLSLIDSLRKLIEHFALKCNTANSKRTKRLEQSKDDDKTSINSKKNNNFDFGTIHLFFESFINNICKYLVEEPNEYVRLEAIRLIKLLTDLNNINIYILVPYVFASMFDYVNEIRYNAIDIILKAFSISKDKALLKLNEGLKFAYEFQKSVFKEKKLINCWVKTFNEVSLKFEETNENVFELLIYKLNKQNMRDIKRQMLEVFTMNLKDMSLIEEKFYKNKYRRKLIMECLSDFEYYEFVAKLIGDFKFGNCQEIFVVLDRLFVDYENEVCIFKTKFSIFKNNKLEPFDMKGYYSHLASGIKILLIRYLLFRYYVFSKEQYQILSVKNWRDFLSTILADQNSSKIKLPKTLEKNITFNKTKFVLFYEPFELFYLLVYKYYTLYNQTLAEKFKDSLINLFNNYKTFTNLKLSELNKIYNNRTKQTIANVNSNLLIGYLDKKNMTTKANSLFQSLKNKIKNKQDIYACINEEIDNEIKFFIESSKDQENFNEETNKKGDYYKTEKKLKKNNNIIDEDENNIDLKEIKDTDENDDIFELNKKNTRRKTTVTNTNLTTAKKVGRKRRKSIVTEDES